MVQFTKLNCPEPVENLNIIDNSIFHTIKPLSVNFNVIYVTILKLFVNSIHTDIS